ncbi:putative ATP-dependent RNA helicase BoYb [Drosophila miranda]|uniref:putative ATP-dependent RNA helicase BoYb n=1 Tax=Drosophila miranda TaxID=7229 RepID=UPI0007E87472|nr:putative ATP-dependent RNA helicase BoYb [Drosophila miranda]
MSKLFNQGDIIQPLVGPNCSDYVVAHATAKVTPFRTFAEVSLLPEILERMRKLGLNRLQRLQSYAWPHLLKGPGHGVLIVSAPRSGRTMGYVPPVCHVVNSILAANRRRREVAVDLLDISHGMGPIALILVPDLNRLAQVAALCSALMPKKETVDDVGIIVTRVLTVPMECTPDFMGAWLNEIGVLVATPARFAKACKQGAGLLKLNQLQVVVFDDVDLMQKEELKLAQQYIPSMTNSNGTHHHPCPQVVMVSQHYTPALLAQVRRYNQHPCLIFGDILEAALYGGMRLLVNMVAAVDKVTAVVKLLRQRPPAEYRTIIFCAGDKEMALLVGSLEYFEYDCLAYYQTVDLSYLDKVSSWTCDTRGVIFVCTDYCPELRIRNAHTIIHYNMSASWGKFKNRYLFLSDNVPNVLTHPKALSPPATATDGRILDSLVLLEEGNAKELPKLVDLMQLHQKLDPNIVAMAVRIRKEMNAMKTIVKPICREILGHGDCWDTMCRDRHYLHEADRRSSAVPCSGDIKVHVLRVYSPGHYCVIVYEHIPPGGKWHDLHPAWNFPVLMNLRLTEERVEPPPRYWPPLHQAVCLWKTSKGSGYTYERVRVLSVPLIENVNLVQSNLMVLVQAMDNSTRRFETNCMSLHVCPDEYVSAPPLCMDLRLLGMVNHMGERHWADRDAQTVQDWLNTAPVDHFVQAKVAFSTSHTIFATCMVSMIYLKTLKVFNLHLNLQRAQVEAKMSKRCDRTKEKILKFFEEHIKLDAPPIPQDPPELEKEPNSCEEARVVANGHKEHIGEDMDKSPPSKQDTSKMSDIVDHELKTGRENRVRQERSQEETDSAEETDSELEPKQSPVMPVGQDQPGESEASDIKKVPIADFYDCLRRCAALDRLEEMEAVTSKAAPCVIAAEPKEEKPKQEKSQKLKLETVSARAGFTASNAARLLRRAKCPDVKYYQTLGALHLQVALVDEKMSYRTRLIESTGVFFQATPIGEYGSESCEFFVNTGMIFKGVQHAMTGRTVYIELQKMDPGYYPTPFVLSKFFQLNYDKMNVEEKWHQRQRTNLGQLMRDYGLGMVQKSTAKEECSEPTESESESEDGVERPEDYRKIDMN